MPFRRKVGSGRVRALNPPSYMIQVVSKQVSTEWSENHSVSGGGGYPRGPTDSHAGSGSPKCSSSYTFQPASFIQLTNWTFEYGVIRETLWKTKCFSKQALSH